MRSLIEDIKLKLIQLEVGGEPVLDEGTWFIKSNRQDFPFANIHEIYRGLSKSEIMHLEKLIERKLPEQLVDFYKVANGLSIFYGSLNIQGLIGEEIKHKPISLQYGTTLDRPIENGKFIDNSNQIRFGGYSADHIDLMMYLDKENIYAVRRFREGPIYYEWPDFKTFLLSEVTRMIELYKQTKCNQVGPLQPLPLPFTLT